MFSTIKRLGHGFGGPPRRRRQPRPLHTSVPQCRDRRHPSRRDDRRRKTGRDRARRGRQGSEIGRVPLSMRLWRNPTGQHIPFNRAVLGVKVSGGRVSLHPSVDLTSGCRAHFVLKDNMAIMLP
nr:DUF6527 family protein [Chenggangzhangella methanolivorans]